MSILKRPVDPTVYKALDLPVPTVYKALDLPVPTEEKPAQKPDDGSFNPMNIHWGSTKPPRKPK